MGSVVGHAVAGAALGGPLGLIAGALIVDLMRGQGQQRMDPDQAEMELLIRQVGQLREQGLRDRYGKEV